MAKKTVLALALTTLALTFMLAEGNVFDTREIQDVFSNRTLSLGSRGDDVSQLQSRLKEIGFYQANVDGIFGHQTLYAVRRYQKEFGLKVDGVVGKQTRESLLRSTKGQPKGQNPGQAQQSAVNSTTGKYNSNDMRIMANAVYGEARGEPYIGQVAVAAVILNRMRSETFPNTVSGVIFEPRAFTAVADGQIWMEPNDSARKAVQDAINGWDPSSGATYYFNPDTATSGWIWTRPQKKKIGKHIFCD
ncbi:spore cortex-lytic enzyme [Desulfuribacillus stibiiarsenatis]|uniref:Spore cortex-lytic enzyme n=1 Tax=Desulfuribacillus stibiiarsenatis TaxID=1390249 RepID=A0A1E5L3P3_9FIRM|nr:spore cortex-lytic enzyme [Desulfuribacillus stibiiarsenatis]OEH84770.1 spore cortex-lytic enzyme [Desulfuribacillus stibiiarsenatis]